MKVLDAVLGQDGRHPAKLLMKNGYEVVGVSSGALVTSFSNLGRLGVGWKRHLWR